MFLCKLIACWLKEKNSALGFNSTIAQNESRNNRFGAASMLYFDVISCFDVWTFLCRLIAYWSKKNSALGFNYCWRQQLDFTSRLFWHKFHGSNPISMPQPRLRHRSERMSAIQIEPQNEKVGGWHEISSSTSILAGYKGDRCWHLGSSCYFNNYVSEILIL